jgi:hypothetical protein
MALVVQSLVVFQAPEPANAPAPEPATEPATEPAVREITLPGGQKVNNISEIVLADYAFEAYNSWEIANLVPTFHSVREFAEDDDNLYWFYNDSTFIYIYWIRTNKDTGELVQANWLGGDINNNTFDFPARSFKTNGSGKSPSGHIIKRVAS